MPMNDSGAIPVRDILCYRKCPLHHAYTRCLLPDSTESDAAFGQAFHEAAQGYATMRLRRRGVCLERLLQIFSHEMEGMEPPIRFGRRETPVTMMGDAIRMLKTLIFRAPKGRVLVMNQPFRELLVEGVPPLQGRIDLIEEVKGVPCIVEWRAVREIPSEFCVAQPFLFALAAERLGWVERDRYRIEIRYLTRTRPSRYIPVSIPFPRRVRIEFKEEMRRCWDGMKAEWVRASPGTHCTECSYKTHCVQGEREAEPRITLAAS